MANKKWNNKEDNEFCLFDKGNIVLFKLKEEQTKEIKLKIINQSYFPNIEKIEKLSEKDNIFYFKSKLDEKKNMDKNEYKFSISIF